MPTDSQSRQIVVFTLGADQYGLAIDQVQEIIRYQPPRLVASPIPAMRGVISLRGRIVPVYDIAELLGGSTQSPEHAKIVIVETAEGTTGVIVDEVDEVLTVDADDFEPLPDTGSQLVESIVKLDDRLIVLINLAVIFEADGPAAIATAPVAA